MYILVPIVVLILFVYLLYKGFLTFVKNPKPQTFGFILGILHFLFIISVIIQTNQDPRLLNNSEGWITFIIVDFPVSLLDFLLNGLPMANNAVYSNYIYPLIIFGLFGTIEYYFIGYILIWLHNRKSLKQVKADSL